MHFAENKYIRWYFNIIYKAADVRINGKTELHHVLSECLCPDFKNLKEQIRRAILNISKKIYPHCNKQYSLGNYTKWHGDNCKIKETE
jgi:hypothetical protein